MLTHYRLGDKRKKGDCIRLGVVRFLPRGVKKADYAKKGYFDVWLPLLAPSGGLVKSYMKNPSAGGAWKKFSAAYLKEIKKNKEAMRLVCLLAVFSEKADISIGCYCEDFSRCHRSLLFELIKKSKPVWGGKR